MENEIQLSYWIQLRKSFHNREQFYVIQIIIRALALNVLLMNPETCISYSVNCFATSEGYCSVLSRFSPFLFIFITLKK